MIKMAATATVVATFTYAMWNVYLFFANLQWPFGNPVGVPHGCWVLVSIFNHPRRIFSPVS